MPPTTKISLQNLSLHHPLLAPSIWGSSKPQPALLNIILTLGGSGFASAADSDKLDSSTIHYGVLAKKIRGGVTADMDVQNVLDVVDGVVKEMGGQGIVERSRVEVCLEKASNYGSGVKVVRERDGLGKAGWEFAVKNVKVMVLVGVNVYEREGRQPLLVDIGIGGEGEFDGEEQGLFRLEGAVVELIEATSFETLETLIEHLFSELRKKTLDKNFPGAMFHLKIAKPRAIAFADAPVVEIFRDIPAAARQGSTAAAPSLCIRKPYAR